MALHRFFLEEQILADETEPTFPLELSEEDRRHARVLRLQPREHIAVIDAESVYYECEVIDPSRPIVRIASRKDAEVASHTLTLCQGIAKGPTMDGLIRSATELGVGRILPFEASRSVPTLKGEKIARRAARWQTIARNASMQAGRCALPVIDQPQTFDGLCSAVRDVDGLLIFWEEAAVDDTLERAFDALDRTEAPLRNVGVVIGPEGGLTDEEVGRLAAVRPRSAIVSLGALILRVETAVICALSQVAYELNRRRGR